MIGMMIATYQMFVDMEIDDPDFLKTQEAEIKAFQKENEDESRGPPKRWKRRLMEYVNKIVMNVFVCGSPNMIDLALAIFAPCFVSIQTMQVAKVEHLFGTIMSAIFFFGFILFHVLEAAER